MNYFSNLKNNLKFFLAGLYTLSVISGCAAGIGNLEKRVQEPPKKEDYNTFSRGLKQIPDETWRDKLGLFYHFLEIDNQPKFKLFQTLDPSSDDSVKVKKFVERYLKDLDVRKDTPDENEYWNKVTQTDSLVNQYFGNTAPRGSDIWIWAQTNDPVWPPRYKDEDCSDAVEERILSHYRSPPDARKCESCYLSSLTKGSEARFQLDESNIWERVWLPEAIEHAKTPSEALIGINESQAEISEDKAEKPKINVLNGYTGEFKYGKDWVVDVVSIPDSNSALGQLEKQLLSSNQDGNFHNTTHTKWTLWNTIVFDPLTIKSEVLKERAGGVLVHKYVIYNASDSVVAQDSTIIPITIDSLVHPDSINIFDYPWVFYSSVALEEGKYNIAESVEFTNIGAKKIGYADFSVNIPPQTGSISDILTPSLVPFKKQKGEGIVTDNPDSNQVCLINHFPFTKYLEKNTFNVCFSVADIPPNSGAVEVRYSLTPVEKRKKKMGGKPGITQERLVVNPSEFKYPTAEMESLYVEFLRDMQREALKPENVLIDVDTLETSNSRLFVFKKLILPIIPENARSHNNNYDFTVQVMPIAKYAMPYMASRLINIKEKPKNDLSNKNTSP